MKIQYMIKNLTREGYEIIKTNLTLDEIENRQFTHDKKSEIARRIFIGLIDKNMVEIYEDDLGYVSFSKYLMRVIDTGGGCYKAQSIKHKNHGLLFCDFDSNEFEVVGNVYENPELLEGA